MVDLSIDLIINLELFSFVWHFNSISVLVSDHSAYNRLIVVIVNLISLGVLDFTASTIGSFPADDTQDEGYSDHQEEDNCDDSANDHEVASVVVWGGFFESG